MGKIAIIPARSGSKGLRDKNVKEMLGQPLMAYTIRAAIDAGIFDCVHVSTDSSEYARIAQGYGAEVPFLREAAYSGDKAGSWDVVRFVLGKYGSLGQEFGMVALLQPTSPLRTAEDILSAYEIFTKRDAQAVVSVCEAEHSPLWCGTLPEDGRMSDFLKQDIKNKGRQALPTYYRLNGAIYMVRSSMLREPEMELYGEGTYAYVMSREHSIDIDEELDFMVAETIMAKNGCS